MGRPCGIRVPADHGPPQPLDLEGRGASTSSPSTSATTSGRGRTRSGCSPPSGDWIEASGDYTLAGTIAEVRAARAAGRMAVAFDLEGMNALDGSLDLLRLVHTLGVRQILFAYNRNSIAGGGCHDEDTGLTGFGRAAVREMNALGMLIDCSHCGYRTTLEAMERSRAPVIFSHSNPRALPRPRAEHPGRAGAGVRGDRGGGRGQRDRPLPRRRTTSALPLSPTTSSTCSTSSAPTTSASASTTSSRRTWTRASRRPSRRTRTTGRASSIRGAKCGARPPSRLRELTAELLRRGRSEAEVRAVLGGNFLRVAGEVWG